jgi:hypothetical protein
MASFDLVSFGAILQGIGSIAGAVAIVIAALIASNTFDSWRKQKLSERRIEQADRILTAAYKARRALRYVRNPMMWAHELDAAEKQLESADTWSARDDDRKQKLILAQGYYNRLNKTVEERKALDECLPMARALFGEDVEGALEELNHQFHLVQVSADASTWEENDPEFRRSIMADLSSAGGSAVPNRINETLESQIAFIEAHCLPVIRFADPPKG